LHAGCTLLDQLSSSDRRSSALAKEEDGLIGIAKYSGNACQQSYDMAGLPPYITFQLQIDISQTLTVLSLSLSVVFLSFKSLTIGVSQNEPPDLTLTESFQKKYRINY
jgi:hypothetical protein